MSEEIQKLGDISSFRTGEYMLKLGLKSHKTPFAQSVNSVRLPCMPKQTTQTGSTECYYVKLYHVTILKHPLDDLIVNWKWF